MHCSLFYLSERFCLKETDSSVTLSNVNGRRFALEFILESAV